MQEKPLIALSASFSENEGKPRYYLNQSYCNALTAAGSVAVIVPFYNACYYAQICDGLLLTGGDDITPEYYGAVNLFPQKNIISKCRDDYEIELVKEFVKAKKPIFGICRGIQLLNVAFGGTLVQDLFEEKRLNHQKVTHECELTKGSVLYDIFKKDCILTNSFHHQAIGEVADDFNFCAKSKDGIVEAIECKNNKNIFAVQWHPELDESNECIFEYFISLCKQK